MADRRFVFLIGAARSGTKFLRDTLAASRDVAAVPYDINYVWRHGNENCPHDEIAPEDIDDKTARHIRTTVKRLALKDRNDSPSIILEKTVSNTLRMETVRRIFPEAEFIVLERDGLDVTESAYRQWTAPNSRNYLLQKLRYFPVREWRYAIWFGRNLASRSDGPPIWGPRYEEIHRDLAELGTPQTCAQQWVSSVRSARSATSEADTLHVEYDSLTGPSGLAAVLHSLDIEDHERVVDRLATSFRHVATWPGSTPEDAQSACAEIVETVSRQT